MIKGVLIGDDKVKAWLESRYPAIQGKLNQSMARLVLRLARKIKEEKLSGQVLKYRTGTLRRSISPRVIEGERVSIGEVSTNKEYAKFHEYGGSFIAARKRLKLPSHLIRRKRGEKVMTGSPYGIHFPKRSFMGTALKEMTPEILAEFEKAISEVIKP